jgi:hypothetical protein
MLKKCRIICAHPQLNITLIFRWTDKHRLQFNN